MTYLDGAGQFLGLVISRPLNGLVNNNISKFFALPNDAKLTFKAIITMRGHVERVDVPVTRETTMLEANTIVRTENRKCIFAKKI